MKVLVGYDEVEELIQKQFNISIKIECVDETTVKVAYSPHKFLPDVNVDVQVLSASDDSIRLVYDSSLAVKKLIDGAVYFMRDKLPTERIEVDTEKASLVLYPSKFKKIKQAQKYMILRDVRFGENGIDISMKLR